MMRNPALGSAAGMVATPWGSSDSLRERMLRPGPGTPPGEVAQNQRERIFGAMVASVATKGYAATRVTDLVELSGVSRRSFYDLFDDKEACFCATTEALVAAALKRAAASEDAGATWEQQAHSRFLGFNETVAEQSAGAWMCLIEAFVAGADAVKPVEEALELLEQVTQRSFDESEERRGMPREMITAFVGAGVEIARDRLIKGTEGELPTLSTDLVDALLAYRPPPEPLRLATRPPTPAPETIDAHDHGERALRAFAMVVADRGYAHTTIDQVVKRAAMSPTTFYANFSGKEDTLMAAIDSATAQITAAVLPGFRRNPDWPHAVRGAFGAFFNFLASRPALTQLLMSEVYAAGREAIDRRAKTLPLDALVAEGRKRAPDVSGVAVEAIAGGIYFLIHKQLRESGTDSLPSLAPVCTYLTLAPFVGAEQACEAANGDGRSRSPGPDPIWEVGLQPEKVELLQALKGDPANSVELASRLDATPERISTVFEELQAVGLVELLEETAAAAPVDRAYRSRLRRLGDEEWEGMSLAERQEISRQIGYLALGELGQSVRSGAFDRRPDRHLSRTTVRVDEQGWRELLDLHDQALDATLEVVEKSAERLAQSGDEGIDGRSMQVLFEMPERD